MTPEIQAIVQRYLTMIDRNGPTLEVGSYDVNGGVAQWFPDYIGTDMRPGPGVNKIVNSHDLFMFFTRDQFTNVVWLETIEHDDEFWRSGEQIYDVLKPGGHLIVSCATLGMPQHDFPSDYWRLTEAGLRELLRNYAILDLQTVGQSVIALAVK